MLVSLKDFNSIETRSAEFSRSSGFTAHSISEIVLIGVDGPFSKHPSLQPDSLIH